MKILFAFVAAAMLVAGRASADDHLLAGRVLCVDPGHTSETSQGTASRDGRLTERHVNWEVALRLRRLLEDAGATVVLTKTRESEVVTNRRRAEIANHAHADLLLRLHCDAASASGIATFYPDRQGTVQGHTGPTPAVIQASHRAVELFHPAAVAALRGHLPDRGIKGDSQTGVGGKQGALTGSIFSEVPALTVEMCVLTNAHDYAFIRTPAGLDAMADALCAGVIAYESGLRDSHP